MSPTEPSTNDAWESVPPAPGPEASPSDSWSDEGPTLDADQETSYSCWACGEEIVIPVDLSMGSRQDYVEDCPVCCRPNEIHVEVDEERGHVRCWNDAM